MEITEIKVFPVREEKLKAFVSIVFDHCFMVNDIKVIQGRDGLFISMPSRRKKNGKFKDVAHPLNNDTRQRIERRVLEKYDEALAAQEAQAAPQGERPVPAAESPKPEPRPAPSRPDPAAEAAPQFDRPRAEAVESVDDGDEGVETPPGAGAPDRVAAGEDQAGSEPPPASAGEEPARSEAPRGEDEDDEGDGSLQEVAERHLRDSFWSS